LQPDDGGDAQENKGRPTEISMWLLHLGTGDWLRLGPDREILCSVRTMQSLAATNFGPAFHTQTDPAILTQGDAITG